MCERMKNAHVSFSVSLATVGALSLSACVMGGDDLGNESNETRSLSEDISILSTFDLDVVQSSDWPRTVTWNGSQEHYDLHAEDNDSFSGFKWRTSWAGDLDGQLWHISTRFSSETCKASAEVLNDGANHTSYPKETDIIDTRDFIGPNDVTLHVYEGTTLSVPWPHSDKHCDRTGSFKWQLKSGGQWIDAIGGASANPFEVNPSPTPGFEDYRIACTHSGSAHYSYPVRVTWEDCSLPVCLPGDCGFKQSECGSIYCGPCGGGGGCNNDGFCRLFEPAYCCDCNDEYDCQ